MSAASVPRPRSLRRLLVALLAAGAALVVGLAPATIAHASPSASDLEGQINTLWNKAEVTIEQYNGVHEQYVNNQKKLSDLEAQLNPLKLQVDLAYTRQGAVSAKLYERGPGSTLNALLTAGTPAVFVDRLSMLNQMAQQQQASVDDVKTKVDQYDKQKQPLDALDAKLKQQDAQLAAEKRSIEAQLDKLQKLRIQLYGSGGGVGGNLEPVACPYVAVGGAAETAAKYACRQIGKPYVWGAAGPNSFDCSGLTEKAWAAAGVSLPHQSAEQYGDTTRVSTPRTGDLVFFNFGGGISHVGLYIGRGWMVHAPHTGDKVREVKVADVGGSVSYGRP